jgi:DNA-nicking Smr family endonuclease
VRDYLGAALAAGFREVRIVHGRGIGVQRERVRALLATHAGVESFADAPPGRGHWGATVVRLRGPERAWTERPRTTRAGLVAGSDPGAGQ